jgi:heme-degrading monooxygenase HmoA
LNSAITAFEVPTTEDDAFLAACGATVLYRALREDADFRFVTIGPEAPGELPFAAHHGRYEVVHEEGAPDGNEGTTLINPFEVPEDGDERFLEAWGQARQAMAARQGYLGTRLHRSLEPADFRFVDVARWSSPLMFARALQDPSFQEAAARMPFASHPSLYIVVEPGRLAR